MNIIFSSDNNYVPLLGVAIYSLFENNKEYLHKSDPNKINVFIMDMDISKKSIATLNSIASCYNSEITYLNTKEIHKYLQNTIKLNVRSLATYYRLFLPSLLPKNIDKVIYMDCDSIINAPIHELWNINMEGYDIAGVLDLVAKEHKVNVGLTEKDPYVNAGMLVINLAKWRTDNMEQQMINFIKKHKGKVAYHDQGTINGVCLQKKIIHPKYNAMTPIFVMTYRQILHYHSLTSYGSKKELIEAKENPIFVHFTPYLTDRPWVKGNFHPLRKLYKEVQSKTPWKGVQFDKPSKTLEPWVRWLFKILPYWLFIGILRFLQWFRIKTCIRKLVGKEI